MEKFKRHLVSQCEVASSDNILVAVSGGMDSVLLCYFFKEIGQPFGIAHCNFNLRDDASDGDEAFVQKLAEDIEVPYFVERFDTYKIAIEQKKSIQVTARELRYSWLENIRKANNFDFLATAHHLNDAVETILYNLTKGCGIRGLHGILPRKNQLIRPLLYLTKSEIRQHINELNINFRADASNESDKYSRNFIRHNIIPKLRTLNPNIEQTFSENINRFREIESLYFQAIETIKEASCSYINDELHIDIQYVRKNDAANSILFEILKPYNFTNTITNQILQSEGGVSGKLYYSNTHLAVLDRTHLIVDIIPVDLSKELEISSDIKEVNIDNNQLKISITNNIPTEYPQSNNIAYFDFDKLKFPLKLRKWKTGDIFQPFGMNGKRKKISTFFRQQKLSIHEKNKTLILESAGEVAWIVGLRTDERFRIDTSTTKVAMIEFQ